MSPEPNKGGEEVPPKKVRKRSNPAPPADANAVVEALLKALLNNPRLQPEFKSRETPADAEHRRRRESLEFIKDIIKDLALCVVAILFISASGVYCFYVLLTPSVSLESKQFVLDLFKILLSGVVGFLFGRNTAK